MNEKERKKGGKRPGAGRRVGSGVNSELTTVIRIPASQKSLIKDLMAAYSNQKKLGLNKENLDPVGDFEFVQPSLKIVNLPALDSPKFTERSLHADNKTEHCINPNEYLIDQSDNTFFVTVQGESMIEAGLNPGDKAVVDKSLTPILGDIVVAMVEGDFTIKTLSKQTDGNLQLLPANSSGQYVPVFIDKSKHFKILGVVTGSFRRFR